MSCLVTDGNERATLAIVRALGQAGVSVTVGHSQPSSLAGSSRHCSDRIVYPSPETEPSAFCSFLLEQVRSGRYRILFAVTDVTLQLVSQIRGELEPHVRLAVPQQEQLDLARDKRRVLLLAKQLGIPCPDTYMLCENEDLAGQQIRFPAVVKPRFSRYLGPEGWVVGAVRYARDAEELAQQYQQAHARIPQPLVQEKIEGPGMGVFLLLWNGELKAAFCHRRLREKPPWGGVSVYRESVPLDRSLVEQSAELLRAMNWQGVAMVEFKLDQRDGQAKLMEVNGRFWGSLQLAVDAGVNFPLLLYRLALGEDVPAQTQYRIGTKSRWLLGDLDHLLIRLARPANGTAGSSRWQACRDFLRFREPDLRYEILRRGDTGPGWFELRCYLREMFSPKRASAGRRPSG